MIETLPLGHLKISSGDMNDLLEFIGRSISENNKRYCVPLNLTKYITSQKDLKLKAVMRSADLVTSDGISMVWLSRRAGYRNVYRITGIDLAEKIIVQSRAKGWKIYFLGASPKNLGLAINNVERKFDNPYISGFHHGYFKQNEIQNIIEIINKSGSDILFLGLGMPQKEYFIHDYFDRINVRFCMAVGGAFDVWADVKKRTPELIQSMGLEWLFRSYYDRSKMLNISRYGFLFLKELLFYRK